MKMFKKMFMTVLASVMIFASNSCGNSNVSNDSQSEKTDESSSAAVEEIVNIKKMTASINNAQSQNDVKKSGLVVYADEEKETSSGNSSLIQEGQYIVIYKDQYNINLRVELDNPEDQEITAIKFACVDPKAEVAVENSKGETEWNLISEYPVVKWGGTDMYKRTFEIKLNGDYTENECAISVLDLQVNNKWQKQPLSNDVLDVYKITKEDFGFEYLANDKRCKFKVNTSEKIKDFQIKTESVKVEDDWYVVEADTRVEYEYMLDGKVKWTGYQDVELVEFDYGNKLINAVYFESTTIELVIVKGSGIDKSYIIGVYENNKEAIAIYRTYAENTIFGYWLEDKYANAGLFWDKALGIKLSNGEYFSKEYILNYLKNK